MRPACSTTAWTARSTEDFVGDIHFQDMESEGFLFREGAEFRGVGGVASVGIAHGGEDGVAVAGKSFGEETAEAGAGTGDENDLFGRHGTSGWDGYGAAD